jgi:MraZ protein
VGKILTGAYSYNIDNKSRLILPAKFREVLDENSVMTNGFESNISIYTAEEWTKFVDKLYNSNSFSADTRSLIRTFVGHAENLVIDQQNRIKLPKSLVEINKVFTEAIIMGVGDHIEIWGKEAYEEMLKNGNDLKNGYNPK